MKNLMMAAENRLTSELDPIVAWLQAEDGLDAQRAGAAAAAACLQHHQLRTRLVAECARDGSLAPLDAGRAQRAMELRDLLSRAKASYKPRTETASDALGRAGAAVIR